MAANEQRDPAAGQYARALLDLAEAENLTQQVADELVEADLRGRVIRTIGTPEERFAEDHLRLLRALRFAAQLDFQIEPATFAAVRAGAPKIRLISAERP